MTTLSAEIDTRLNAKPAEVRRSGVLYLAGKDQIGALRLASDFLCLRRAKVVRTQLRPFATFAVRTLVFEAAEPEYRVIVAALDELQRQFPRCRVAIIDGEEAPADDRVGEVLWLSVRGASEGTLVRVKAALRQALGPAMVGTSAGNVAYHRCASDEHRHTIGVTRIGGFTPAAARELRQMLAQISLDSQVLCAAEEASTLRAG